MYRTRDEVTTHFKMRRKNIKKSAMDLFSLEPKSYIQSSSYETMKGVFEDSYKNYSTLGTADFLNQV